MITILLRVSYQPDRRGRDNVLTFINFVTLLIGTEQTFQLSVISNLTVSRILIVTSITDNLHSHIAIIESWQTVLFYKNETREMKRLLEELEITGNI